ncbi:zf-HC2 domain-containing protein [Streptomyces sp. bgisy100]|uniref:anti-sigma factor family protein n=1 Tax=Streptomyces sp. bgisy100 TaxID=3413783 RepID=UPI003D730316
MTGSGGASHAEQHLGDRLAALVDGELGHDARERVLAHLATCCTCKAEADAQRKLKSFFAETAEPTPSEGLLARLQGLPGGDPGREGAPFGSGNGFGDGVFGMSPEQFAYGPAGAHRGPDRSGFRIHDVERSASRGRRFAFAAAGAVSLAAFALGGALPFEGPGETPSARGDGAVKPVRTAPSRSGSAGGGEGLLVASAPGGQRIPLTVPSWARRPSSPLPSAEPSGPLFPYASPVLTAPTVLSPLIRPAAPVRQDIAHGGKLLSGAPAASPSPSSSSDRSAPVVAATAPEARASTGR